MRLDDEQGRHTAAKTAGGYSLQEPDFLRLRHWHGILFQLSSARYFLQTLAQRKLAVGQLKEAYQGLALLQSFVLQYSKCFSSAGPGQVTLDEHQVFKTDGEAKASHRRILEIRNSLVAHNGDSDLVIADIGVKELPDRFVIKHYLTLALPINELAAFATALNRVEEYATSAINKHLDKIGERLGKIVLLDEI
jgi:hypothetical protein